MMASTFIRAKGQGVEYYEGLGIYDSDQLYQIRMGMNYRLGIPDFGDPVYANPAFSAKQMKQVWSGILANVDISLYADPSFSHHHMRYIRKSLRYVSDISPLLDLTLNSYQLYQIYKGLRYGVNVQTYKDPSISAENMEKARLSMYKGTGAFNKEGFEVLDAPTGHIFTSSFCSGYHISVVKSGYYSLDEACSGLDEKNSKILKDYIKSKFDYHSQSLKDPTSNPILVVDSRYRDTAKLITSISVYYMGRYLEEYGVPVLLDYWKSLDAEGINAAYQILLDCSYRGRGKFSGYTHCISCLDLLGHLASHMEDTDKDRVIPENLRHHVFSERTLYYTNMQNTLREKLAETYGEKHD